MGKDRDVGDDDRKRRRTSDSDSDTNSDDSSSSKQVKIKCCKEPWTVSLFNQRWLVAFLQATASGRSGGETGKARGTRNIRRYEARERS